MRFQVASTVRSLALRSSRLSLENISSIGFRSGEWRQEEELDPGRPQQPAHLAALVGAEIVDDDDGSRLSIGSENWL